MFTIAGGTALILRTQVAATLLKLPQTRDGSKRHRVSLPELIRATKHVGHVLRYPTIAVPPFLSLAFLHDPGRSTSARHT